LKTFLYQQAYIN